MKSATKTKKILDLESWKDRLPSLQEEYQQAEPYPHIVLDDFLHTEAAEKLYESFPNVGDSQWIHYVHVNEKKHGLNKLDNFPDAIREAVEYLNSEEFVSYLSELTGIDGLKADPSLEGGGLHQTERGGYLNVHADFTVHPHKRKWRRRVNLLLYLNPKWKKEYNGQLELWERDMSAKAKEVYPWFNRCVIFNTDEDSYHGVPETIKCPEGDSRKSIALYYFTEEEKAPKKRATNYRARPQDGWKSIMIYLDKQILWLYNEVKGILGIDDRFVSKILRYFDRKKK